MPTVITMNSKEFLKKFVKNYDYSKFVFFVISQDVKSKGKYDNVYNVQSLLPPPYIVSEYVNNGISDEYVSKYMNYLSMPKNEALLTVMVKMCVADNRDIVLLCSDNETQYKYLSYITKYMQTVFKIKAVQFKKYNKNPKKCNSVVDKDRTIKILSKKLDRVKPDFISPKINKSLVKDKLKSLSDKKLKAYCKANGIKTKGQDRKDLIKSILNAL